MICKKNGILKLRSKQGPKQTLFSSEAIGQIRIVQNSSHAAWEKHLKSNQLTLGHSLNPRPVRISFPATANHVSRAAERRTRPPVQGGDSTRHSLRWVWFGLVWHTSLLPCSSWKHAFCAVAATGCCPSGLQPDGDTGITVSAPGWPASIWPRSRGSTDLIEPRAPELCFFAASSQKEWKNPSPLTPQDSQMCLSRSRSDWIVVESCCYASKLILYS